MEKRPFSQNKTQSLKLHEFTWRPAKNVLQMVGVEDTHRKPSKKFLKLPEASINITETFSKSSQR